MMKTTKGQALWKKANELIPMGTQLLSKNADQFLPGRWPSYFKKAKGIEVWDLDGNVYLDFTIMGVGSCILGYADKDVNKAVKNVIDSGNMCTLNSPEEVELAKILLEMENWAGMVRYARTGGEAMAIAVRIARAYSGKDIVAFCGYHGWHDWYLAANLAQEKNLDGHLLPGLKPVGVPRALLGTAIPFEYNRPEQLEEIVKKHDIGVIVMEPIRSYYPENGFLQKVREIADTNSAVLIFDEITSGFRMRVGGAYKLFDVIPDIVVYAKAISNGYPMAAIVGKKEIMEKATDSFISSTYWTERIGPAAAIATIKKLKEKDVPNHLINLGNKIMDGWKQISDKTGIKIKISGIPPLPKFAFEYGNSRELMTLFTQEMLEKGFLARDSVYLSYSHKKHHIDRYLEAVEEVFKKIKKGIDKKNIKKILKVPVASSGFRRLT
ncbi:MAG: aminotransferase class III-fold pyridoxal phosphate-dependent enzyme [Candidatus Omnitrophica bacterium]|nr:aminotransferase class III-fold pyridoxal phosphate-dependent enzyme [Candidatus Omnitrophota bacterium]